MKTGKGLSLLLALLLAASLLAGCGQTPDSAASTAPDGGNDAAVSAGPSAAPEDSGVKFPLADPAEFSMWTTMYDTNFKIYTTLAEHPVIKKMQELTNVSITFVHPALGSENETFNLMMASQDYNDVISTSNTTDSPTTLHDNDVIIDLTDLIGQYMPNYKGIIDSDPNIAKDCKDDSSKYLVVNQIYDTVPFSWSGLVVRKDLLDKAGLGLPETYDDWEKVGLAFKDMGLEKPLYIPATGSYTVWSTFESGFGVGSRFYRDGSTVKYGPLEPGYKEFLTKMRDWYEKGVIDQNFAGGTGFLNILGIPDFAEFNNGKIGGCLITSSFLGTLPVETKQTTIADMYVASTYTPVQNKGDKVNFSTADGSGRVAFGFGITTAASEEIVPVILSYFDYLYSAEGSILANYGLEGDSLEYDADGKPHYTKIINTTAVDGVNFFHVYDKALLTFPFLALDKERILGRAEEILKLQEKWVVTGTDLAVIPRKLSMTADKTAKVSSITNDANTYASEMSVKFITGAESLDNYDTMVDTIKAMGIDEAISIQQAALDRYNAR